MRIEGAELIIVLTHVTPRELIRLASDILDEENGDSYGS